MTRAVSTAKLQLCLLGAFDVRLNGVPVAFRYDKLRALLAYLALGAGRAHPRAALVGLLWPEAPEADARRNLSQALFNLRQALGEGSDVPVPAEPFLLVSREALEFNGACDYVLDVARFEALLAATATHAHTPAACQPCAAQWQEAAALYRGDFLQNFYLPDSSAFEDWALLKREELRRQALAALAQLTAHFERQADYAQGIPYARRQLALEPWREEAHRDLMRLLALNGQRSAALAQYEAARKALADELGVAPAPETEALLAQIKAGHLQPHRADVAPVLSTPAAPLPVPLTPFVGREHELAELDRLLADPACRLLTLTGPGGIGKTRLALQAAAQQRHWPDGVAFVPLAPVNDGRLLAQTISTALGFAFEGTAEPQSQLLHFLRPKALLLVLDNFEHLLESEAAVGLVASLLQTAPRLKLLVTSRAPLALQGEWVYEVAGLAEEAVSLFEHSARRARAGFQVQPADAAAIDRIIQLVGGLPLGIELAAAWVRVLAPREIAQEIERDVDFLTTTARDVPARHRSIQAVFEYSWTLLSPEEQPVLLRLAVFRGGFGREAAERVAQARLSLLSSLVGKSLVRRTGAGRYDLHELVRQYLLNRLAQSPGDLDRAHAAHCAYYSAFMATRSEALQDARQAKAIADVAAEFDDVQAAWHWAVEHGRVEDLTGMAFPVYLFCQRRGRYRDGLALMAQAITMVETEPRPHAQEALVAFLLARGWFLTRLGQFDRADADFVRAQALYERLGRPRIGMTAVDPLMARGSVALGRGDFAAALALFEEAVPIVEARGDPISTAYIHLYLALTRRTLGQLPAGEHHARKALDLAQAIGQPSLIGYGHDQLGLVAEAQGDLDTARHHFEAAYAPRAAIGDLSGLALDLAYLGRVALASGDLPQARQLFERSQAMDGEMRDQAILAMALDGLGRTAAAQGLHLEAWEQLTQALATAHRASHVPMVLAILTSLAEVLCATGDHRRARRLLAAIFNRPNNEPDTRARAERLWERVGGGAANDDGGDLAVIVSAILSESL